MHNKHTHLSVHLSTRFVVATVKMGAVDAATWA